MKTPLNIEKIIAKGLISNELDYERALIANRSLRLITQEHAHLHKLSANLHDLIEAYEKLHWASLDQVDDRQIAQSDKAEEIAEQERLFVQKRKNLIREQLKRLQLSQEELATLLGHKSKTHMSQLINGFKSFTLRDLIVIHRLLQIDMQTLIPTFLAFEEEQKVKNAALQIDKPELLRAIAQFEEYK